MKLLIGLTLLVALIALYVTWLRPWLQTKSWAAGFFAAVEPVEIFLFKKSETILWSRLKMFAGVALMALAQLGTIDLTPLMPFVPDAYEPFVKIVFNLLPLLVTLDGTLGEKLRRGTSKPLEIVALPDATVAASPALQEVVAKAEEVKLDAVAMAPEVEAVQAAAKAA